MCHVPKYFQVSLLSFAIQSAFALPTDEEIPALDEVIVTATGLAVPIDHLPPSITRLGRAELEQRGVTELQDLGAAEAGVDISRSGRFGLDKINIRGISDRRIVFEIDGIAQQERLQFGPLLTVSRELIDFSSLAEVDVVRGHNSARPELSALGSTISLRTLQPEDILRDRGQTLAGRSQLAFNSADNSVGENLSLAGDLKQGTLWLLHASRRDAHTLDNKANQAGYSYKRTLPDPQNTGRNNVLAKLQHHWGGHQLGFTAEAFSKKTNTWMLGHYTASVLKSVRAKDEQTRERVSLDYHWEGGEKALFDAATLKLYHQNSDTFLHDDRLDESMTESLNFDYVQKMLGGKLRFQQHVNTPIRQNWTYGADFSRVAHTEYRNKLDCYPLPDCTPEYAEHGSDVPRSKSQNFGAFVQNELTFADAKFTLAPSIRFDKFIMTPDPGGSLVPPLEANPRPRDIREYNFMVKKYASLAPGQRRDSRMSPKLAASYRVSPSFSVFGQYGRGFRAPSFDELNTSMTRSSYSVISNRFLKPETSETVELGLRVGQPKLGGSMTLFNSSYKNFIERSRYRDPKTPKGKQDRSFMFQYVNRQNVRIYGTEMKAHWAINAYWRLASSLIFAQGDNQDTHQPLDSVPPVLITNALRYDRQHWGSEVLVTTSARKKRVSNEEMALKTPGYAKFDVKAWLKPIRDLSVNMGVYNLLDKKYATATDLALGDDIGTFTPQYIFDRNTAPGRHVKLALSYAF